MQTLKTGLLISVYSLQVDSSEWVKLIRLLCILYFSKIHQLYLLLGEVILLLMPDDFIVEAGCLQVFLKCLCILCVKVKENGLEHRNVPMANHLDLIRVHIN